MDIWKIEKHIFGIDFHYSRKKLVCQFFCLFEKLFLETFRGLYDVELRINCMLNATDSVAELKITRE